jgi:hypothetical protein
MPAPSDPEFRELFELDPDVPVSTYDPIAEENESDIPGIEDWQPDEKEN